MFCSMQDPAEAVPSGYNSKNCTAVWGKPGKTEVSSIDEEEVKYVSSIVDHVLDEITLPHYFNLIGFSICFQVNIDLHTSIMEAYKPVIYQALCDSDTDNNSSNKRIKKSVDRTLDFLDSCLQKKEESDVSLEHGELSKLSLEI